MGWASRRSGGNDARPYRPEGMAYGYDRNGSLTFETLTRQMGSGTLEMMRRIKKKKVASQR